MRATGDGGFIVDPIEWVAFAKALPKGGDWQSEHADLAASVQRRLEEVILSAGDVLDALERLGRGPRTPINPITTNAGQYASG